MISNQPTHAEEFRLKGLDEADKEAAASLLEDLKSATLAQWCAELGEMPVNRAEQIVKASPRWEKYIRDTVEARREAGVAKVEKEYAKMKFYEWQAMEANGRAELRMMGATT